MEKGRFLFCDGWQFALTEPDSNVDAISDVHWYNVEIPHDWLIGDTANLYKSGCGWYKKKFKLEEKGENDCYIICFDGVYMDTTVYVNGSMAGEWKYGYTSFSFDITDYLHNGDNEILVRVNYKSPNSRWYSGAGIYRNVYLRHTSKTHIVENGTYITTHCNYHVNENNPGKWKITIETTLNCEFDGVISYTVCDPENRPVFEADKRICSVADKTSYYTDTPVLWEVGKGQLYTVKSVLKTAEGEILDTAENKFGHRVVTFDPEKGLFINCKHTKLNGVCMHHDLGALGAAVNYDATYRQMTKLQAMGVNAIRTSHNPPSRELMEICDKLGLLVISEFLDMWELAKTEFDYARFILDWYPKDVASWICRDRNHPSVIMWSIGNEIPDTHHSARGLELATMLKTEVEKYDYNFHARVTIGSNYMAWENGQKVADYLKVVGYNYAERLYGEHHKAHPDWVIYGSETASTVRSRGIYHFPADTALLTFDDLQCSDLCNSVVNWGATPLKSFTMDRDARFSMGQFVWTGFDYIGEPTPYSTKNSYFGIIDTAGIEKDSFWLYKSLWDTENTAPFIHICPYWDYNEGQIIDIMAYSNQPVLKLIYGEEEFETIVTDKEKSEVLFGHWKVHYSKDKTVKVVGYSDKESGKVTCESSIAAFGDAYSIDLVYDKTEIAADGRSLIFVTVAAKDKNGNYVANANNRIKFNVSGPARLVGLDNGDSTDYDSYKGDNRKLFSGKLTAILQSTFDEGDIVFTAEGEGLQSASASFKSVHSDNIQGVSVVNENRWEAVTNPYTTEIPVRKLEIKSLNTRQLDENNKTDTIEIKIYPENATYSDIGFKCCSDNGVEINYAEVTDFDGKTATVRAKGDGNFRLRAFAKNSSDIPKVISELEYSVTGLGEATKSPYKYIAACLYDFSNVNLNTIDRGALGGFYGRTVVGFSAVDFGKAGSDRIIVTAGNCGGGEPFKVDLYDGDADNGGVLIKTLEIPFNGGWDQGYPVEIELGTVIKGLHDLSFVINDNFIFTGIEFVRADKAYSLNYAGNADNVYGDDFNINGKYVEKIGNNVVIEFAEMDFGTDGTAEIEITGRTPLDHCTIQIRATDINGTQTTRIVEFPYSEQYTAAKFAIDNINGIQDISFVFLPGAKFDMESFKFTK